MLVHSVDGAGAYLTWPKPFRALVVIEPPCPVVRSLRPMTSPWAVSCSVTVMLSPEFMKRSALGSGVKVWRVDSTGLGGEFGCGRPFLVMNAKFTYSTPVRTAQLGFRSRLVTALLERLSMFRAAHHFVASQLLPGGQSTQPGGEERISMKATPGRFGLPPG